LHNSCFNSSSSFSPRYKINKNVNKNSIIIISSISTFRHVERRKGNPLSKFNPKSKAY